MDHLVTGLYTQFVLRDFLGRMVPGAVFLLVTALGFVSGAQLHAFVSQLTTTQVALGAGVSWTAATGLQYVCDLITDAILARRGLPGDDRGSAARGAAVAPVTAGRASRANARQHRLARLVAFSRAATEVEKMRRERFAVLRHACTTTAAALVLGAALCVASAACAGELARVGRYWPHLVWLLPSATVLVMAGAYEYRSQQAYEGAVLDTPKVVSGS